MFRRRIASSTWGKKYVFGKVEARGKKSVLEIIIGILTEDYKLADEE